MGTSVQADFEAWLARQPRADSPREAFRREVQTTFLRPAESARVLVPREPRPWTRFAVLALAAAAILAVTFLLPSPERWAIRLSAPASLAGTEYTPRQAQELAVELEGSGTFESQGEDVHFSLGNALELELLADSELTFPMLPELDGVTPVWFQLDRGEVFLRTADSYPGNPIFISTSAAEVEVRGTTLGVLVDERGTCVCVAEGRVGVTSDRLLDGAQDVEAGMSLVLFEELELGAELLPFPTAPGTAEYEHVSRLVEFEGL